VLTICLNIGEDLRPCCFQFGGVCASGDQWESIEGEVVGAPVSWRGQNWGLLLPIRPHLIRKIFVTCVFADIIVSLPDAMHDTFKIGLLLKSHTRTKVS